MGEGIGNEALLMPFITAANIACGYHAGDDSTMAAVVQLCKKHSVHIGAHPSFNDKENFGRTEMHLPLNDIYDIVFYQLAALKKIAAQYNCKLHHVKPHGALYNMAAKSAAISGAIVKAAKDVDASLIFYGLSGSVMVATAQQAGLRTFNEVFADRTYQDDGSLTPRSQSNALINSVDEVLTQAACFASGKKLRSVNGKEITITADTICVHGDGSHAVDFAKAIYQHLKKY